MAPWALGCVCVCAVTLYGESEGGPRWSVCKLSCCFMSQLITCSGWDWQRTKAWPWAVVSWFLNYVDLKSQNLYLWLVLLKTYCMPEWGTEVTVPGKIWPTGIIPLGFVIIIWVSFSVAFKLQGALLLATVPTTPYCLSPSFPSCFLPTCSRMGLSLHLLISITVSFSPFNNLMGNVL